MNEQVRTEGETRRGHVTVLYLSRQQYRLNLHKDQDSTTTTKGLFHIIQINLNPEKHIT